MVVTWIVGGTMAGYCETGNTMMATNPTRTRKSAITFANIGRSIKNLEIILLLSHLSCDALLLIYGVIVVLNFNSLDQPTLTMKEALSLTLSRDLLSITKQDPLRGRGNFSCHITYPLAFENTYPI
ncbi:protein of unknown function [Legionella fallonii LLAP-10]|uniref:Uncharacterized protein n=1 Tax=Legionella fallonii LLAP-10 TaxID=1212491 RepID=A0A098G2G0_9GAMM|nr:protein of unknown function [Legionella fallonii LLAP-10]